MSYDKCISCGEEFSDENTHTRDGWLETQISGMCEDCFDEMLLDVESEMPYE